MISLVDHFLNEDPGPLPGPRKEANKISVTQNIFTPSEFTRMIQ